jgi:hypothetical protein
MSGISNFRQEQQNLSPSTTRPPETATMPRLRGKSRRGAAWYRAESRRRRLKQFEKALTLASIRRRRNPRVPPKAIAEHLSPEEAMQIHPPLVASEECRQWTEAHQGEHSVAEREEPNYPPCIVKEEEPPDETHYPPCIVEEEEPPAEAKVQTEEKRTPPRPPEDSSAHTAKNPGARTSNDKERMDHDTFPELWHLPLVFELRSMLDDLAFRIARMDQRIDMLFAAFSKNAPKKQCPTCAQEYLIPVGWSRAGHKRARSSQQFCRSPG